MIIVLIAGITGSGKSSLARSLSQELRQRNRSNFILSQDDYRRLGVESDEEDALETFQFDILIKNINNICNEQPPYALQKYNFKSDSMKEYILSFKPKILLIEGTYTLHHQELLKLANYKIFLEHDIDLCLVRRLIRDTVKRGKYYKDILTKYIEHIRPTIVNIINPSATNADLIVKLESSIVEIVNKITNKEDEIQK
jgi:uridine kinase